MRPGFTLGSILSLAALLLSSSSAFATPASPSVATPQLRLGAQPAPPLARGTSARALVRVTLGRGRVWAGQAIPLSVTAQFRDVDGVTLEGLPQLKSDSVLTSSLAGEPHQATQIIAGEPVLVATWSGTVTPSKAGPLALSVELPVRIRFHDAPVEQLQSPEPDDDPFPDMFGLDPFDPGSMDRIFRSLQRSMPRGFGEELGGRSHDQALTLKASARPLDVQALPLVGQPANFNGAVGHFNLHASLPATTARASEPITLSVTLEGDGDLDRVDLAGLKTTPDFKAYPISAKSDAKKAAQAPTRRVFEQVLVPTHGGPLEIPALTLAAFDPTSGHYESVATAPLHVDVEGPPPATLASGSLAAAPLAAGETARAAAPHQEAPVTLPPPPPSALLDSPKKLGLELSPALALILAALSWRVLGRRDVEAELRKELRRKSKQDSAAAFFEAARRLITVHFAKRWHVPEAEVTAEALRTQLGDRAEAFVQVLVTADGLRFGRRSLEPFELSALCASVEQNLKEAQ